MQEEKPQLSVKAQKPSAKLIEFLSSPVHVPNKILLDHHLENSTFQKSHKNLTPQNKHSGAEPLKSPLRNVKILESLAKYQNDSLNVSVPKIMNVKREGHKRMHTSTSQVLSSPRFSQSLMAKATHVGTTNVDTSGDRIMNTEHKNGALPLIGGRSFAGVSKSMNTGLLDATDLSKSQIFHTADQSISMSNKGSFLGLTPKYSRVTKDQSSGSPSSQLRARAIFRSKDFLQANDNHTKSLQLLDFLEKRTDKRARSLQQRMVDAMDRSIKKGPLKMPHKLLKQLSKEEKCKKVFKAQKRDAQMERKESISVSHQESGSQPPPSEQILPEFRTLRKRDPQLPKSYKVDAKDTQGQAYDEFIPQILEQSINLKFRDDYNERKAEYSAKIQENKIKAKMRASIAVNKLLNQEATSIEDFLGKGKIETSSEPQAPEKSAIHKKAETLCRAHKDKKPKQVTSELHDQTELQISRINQQRQLGQLKTRLLKQKNTLVEANMFEESDQVLIDQIRTHEDQNQGKPQLDYTRVEAALADLVDQKFVSQGALKIEAKTLKLLYDEVLKQVRQWSGRHADLLQELVKRKEAIKAKSVKQVKQTAHLVKNKLANTIANLQKRVTSTEHILQTKIATVDLAMKSQDQLERNFERAMKQYHSGNQARQTTERNFEQLKEKLVSWMPNFTKYANYTGLQLEKLVLIAPNEDNPKDKAKLWEMMEQRLKFDSDADMWGFQKGQTPDSVIYQQEPLTLKYKRPELWLRSDISRLIQIFSIGIPAEVKLETAQFDIRKLKHELERHEKIVSNLDVELKVRYNLLKKYKEQEFLIDQNADRVVNLEKLVERMLVPKQDQGTQVTLMQETLTKFNPNEKPKKSKEERAKIKRDRSIQQLLSNNSINIDLGLTKIDQTQEKDKNGESSPFKMGKNQKIEPIDAQKKLKAMHDIELGNIQQALSSVSLNKMRFGEIDRRGAQLQPHYELLHKFMDLVLKQSPITDGSAWRIYQQLLKDNNIEIMQGLQDLETMGHEDWRFAVVQKLCCIQYNKDKVLKNGDSEKANIKLVLIDKKEKGMAAFISSLTNKLAQNLELLRFFRQGLLQSDENQIVDFEVVLQSIIQAARSLLGNQKVIKKTVLPMLVSLVYELISKEIGRVEFYKNESVQHERLVLDVIYDECESDNDIEEVKFLIELIFAAQIQGIGEFENHTDQSVVDHEQLDHFLKRHLKLKIPNELTSEKQMQQFIRTRLFIFRRNKTLQIHNQDQLTVGDLRMLEIIFVKQFMTLKESFIQVVKAARVFSKLRQSLFEPIFSNFRGKDGYLSLTGSFYQSLLFISKCNVSTGYLDANSQQKAYDRINSRTKQLINTLKNQQQFKQIGLSKFAECCLDLGLESQLNGALRKLNKQELLMSPEKLTAIKDAAERLNPTKSAMNASVHGEIRQLLSTELVINKMLQAGKMIKLANPSKFCAMQLLSSNSNEAVLDPLNLDSMRPNFDVYLDCGLAELAMTIQASLARTRSQSKRAKRRKLKQAMALQLQKQHLGLSFKDLQSTKQVNEIAIQTGDSIRLQEQEESSMKEGQLRQMSQRSRQSLIKINQNINFDDAVRIFQESKNGTTPTPASNIQEEEIQDELQDEVLSKLNEDYFDQFSVGKKHNSATSKIPFQQSDGFKSESQLAKQALIAQEETLENLSNGLRAITLSKFENGVITQNTWKLQQTQTFSEKMKKTLTVAESLAPMQHPIIAVSHSKSKPVLGQQNFAIISSPMDRNKPSDFLLKAEIITGENKWREEVQKHKERLQDARSTQHAKWSLGGNARPTRSLTKHQSNQQLRNLNSDLAHIDDKSDFSGSFVGDQTPKKRRLKRDNISSYSPELNQKTKGQTGLNQINMSGEERKFTIGLAEISEKNLSPKKGQYVSFEGSLSIKASQTLKLIKTSKDRKQDQKELQQVKMTSFGFDQLQIGSNDTNAQASPSIVKVDSQNESYVSVDSQEDDELLNEDQTITMKDDHTDRPFLMTQKINLEQRTNQKGPTKKVENDLRRDPSVRTLIARYSDPDSDDAGEEAIKIAYQDQKEEQKFD